MKPPGQGKLQRGNLSAYPWVLEYTYPFKLSFADSPGKVVPGVKNIAQMTPFCGDKHTYIRTKNSPG